MIFRQCLTTRISRRPDINSTRPRRRVRFQSLERRQMLAGDLCDVEVVPTSSQTTPAPTLQSVLLGATEYAASDAAGGTLASAANLGVIEGSVQRRGSLSWLDRLDIVHFEITEDSQVSFAVDQLGGNADLYLINRQGNILASSTNRGFGEELIRGKLRSGEYYLAVSARTFSPISYRLSLDVEPLVPINESPSSDSPATETPAETTPSLLPEVDDFGSSLDWNLNAIGAPESWAAGYTGQGVTVAVIDTGVDLDHPDLQHSIYVNAGEIPGNGIDDDQNGYVDDVSGYDFVDGDADANDGNGHGTHVAGTIAAANNSVGATGVAPEANVLPIRVLDDSGRGSDSGVAAGIRYAADIGAQIINLSLGGGTSSRIAAAIEYATSLGSLVVAAAGNESSAVPSYPAQYSRESTSVLSVGAFDSSGQIASFSNGVGSSGAVQIDAPGVGIYSTYLDGRYATLSGTSMATPHVAGVAALILSADPDLTSSELRELLASETIGQVNGSDSLGKLSTLSAVAMAAAGTSVNASTDSQVRASTSSTTVRATWMPRSSSDARLASSNRLLSPSVNRDATGGRHFGDEPGQPLSSSTTVSTEFTPTMLPTTLVAESSVDAIDCLMMDESGLGESGQPDRDALDAFFAGSDRLSIS